MLFNLLRSTVEDNRHFYIFETIQELRKKFSKDNTTIHVTDLGSGSHVSKSNQRTVSSIYHSAVSGTAKSALLFRLALWLQPKAILELGTSLGISSVYLHNASPKAKLTTIEGCPNIYKLAHNHLKDIPNVGHVNSDFDSFLEQAAIKGRKYDMVYIDGNHQLEATLKYAKTLRISMLDKSIIIFDDIYWSKGMSEAWQRIKADRLFDCTVDMYQFGIGIIDKRINKYEDIVIVPRKYKPWKLGIWGK